ncbi:O-acetylhomoserine aminocarboxypropyltransferase/cysteine synthase [Dehalococcoidia bacterium]|nr:O-acetylhomoserine aminocarboxypropyltransferase/cysteine synthase [Dehalococcoidia bacterium]
MKFDTLAIHAGHQPDSDTNARAVPIYRTSSYTFNDTDHAADLFALKILGNIYTRIQNPTQGVLEERVAALEGGAAALALASGTSGVFNSIVNICQNGDEIVSANDLYGGTYTMFNDILPKFGISVKWVDPTDPSNFEEAITDKTKLLFCETVSNPALHIADTEKISTIAHNHGIPLIVDATFTTPYLQRPIDFGADILVHSLTKWLGGHGNGIGGVVVDSGKFDWTNGKFPLMTEPEASYHDVRWALDIPEELRPIAYILRMRVIPLRNLGACISPDNAWTFLQGIETLSLRMDRHCENSLKVAEFLSNHDRVDWVRYPGLKNDSEYELNKKYLKGKGGPLVVFGIKGGSDSGRKFIDSLDLFSHLANVGDAKSLAIHPATTTHSQLSEEQQIAGGITPDLVRLSPGIEDSEDILSDLDQALQKSV